MKKVVGSILLDRNDNYVYNDGKLPERLPNDKEWLKYFVKDEVISPKGAMLLPPSILEGTYVSEEVEPLPITISEIDTLSDILIVIRNSTYNRAGKKFRFDKFKRLFEGKETEIWVRK